MGIVEKGAESVGGEGPEGSGLFYWRTLDGDLEPTFSERVESRDSSRF